MSHNIFEGRKCVEAAEKYKRIVQHGTQSRSVSSWRKTAAAIASGNYGKLLEFDPEKEQFVGNEAANKLLTRAYREPFVVPATV